MGYTLVLSGLPGTGSVSFWLSFGFHPEIKSSLEKEPGTILVNNVFIPTSENYIGHYYKVDEKTKVLLDGSIIPSASYINFLRTIKHIDRICVIFRLRNSRKRLFSDLRSNVGGFLGGFNMRPSFLNEDLSINYDMLCVDVLKILKEHVTIENVIKLVDIKNVLIIDLDYLFEKQQEIFSFLKVDTNIVVPRRHMNQRQHNYVNKDHLRIMQKIEEFVFDNSDRFNVIIRRSNRIIRRSYNVIGEKNE